MTHQPETLLPEMPELLPCPFCGGEPERITLEDEDNFGGDVITCKSCQASSHVEFGRKENIVSRWNTRADLAQPAKVDADAVADKCLDCGCDMISVCSGLEINANGENAGKCPTGTERQPAGSPYPNPDAVAGDRKAALLAIAICPYGVKSRRESDDLYNINNTIRAALADTTADDLAKALRLIRNRPSDDFDVSLQTSFIDQDEVNTIIDDALAAYERKAAL